MNNYYTHRWRKVGTRLKVCTWHVCADCGAEITSGPMGTVQTSGPEVCPAFLDRLEEKVEEKDAIEEIGS